MACYCMMLIVTTGCEGSELYEVGAPGWLSDKNAEEVKTDIVSVTPTPATVGAADNTTAFCSVFSDDVKAEPGKTYQVKFINRSPGTDNWNNFVIVLRKGDKTLGDAGQYALFRADNYGWCNGNFEDKADQHCTYEIESKERDWLAWKQSMTMSKVTVDITNKGDGRVDVKCVMQGADGGTYTQNYLDLSGVDKDDLYFTFSVDHSSIEFGDIEIKDGQPVSMKLNNVPAEINMGDDLSQVMSKVTADVFFDGISAPKTIKADELQFKVLPDMETGGAKTLAVIYNKTYLGKAATTPAVATQSINLVAVIASIEVTKQPTVKSYENVFTNGYPFLTDGLEVTATFNNGYKSVLSLENLTFSALPCTVGTHNITISTANGKTATVQVTVNTVITTNLMHPTPTTIGAEDNTTPFFGVQTNAFKAESGKTYQVNFTNYGGTQNYENFILVLRKADTTLGAAGEYGVLRSDNWGWGNGFAAEQLSQHCTASFEAGRDWGTWLKAMNKARVFSCISNNGDGKVDVRIVMLGKDGKIYKQDYLNFQNNIDVNDLNVAFTLEKSHLVFE